MSNIQIGSGCTNDPTTIFDDNSSPCFCRDSNSQPIDHESGALTNKLSRLYNALLQLKQTGTRGLYDLDGKSIQLCAPAITDTLTYIYNLCIDRHYFPKAFKQAKVIPIYMSWDRKDFSDYRPTSILSVISEPLEKHRNNHLLSHLKTNELLTSLDLQNTIHAKLH